MRGGKRNGSGRKAGSKTKKTAEIAVRAAEQGLTPLEFMLNILRDETQPSHDRFEAAKAAAPFVHPRLAAVEIAGALTLKQEEAVDLLRRGSYSS